MLDGAQGPVNDAGREILGEELVELRSGADLPAEMREEMARNNLAFFAMEYLGMELGEHHLDWADLVTQYKLIDVLAARGHGKSAFFSFAYPIWQSWRTPKNRGLLISDTSDQVEEFFRIIKEGVEFVDELGFTWRLPPLVDTELAWLVPASYERTWTGSKIHFTNGSRFVGKTFGKRFRGRHVPWIVVDDPHGDDASYSEIVRNKDWAFLKASIEPMLLAGGQMVIIGTPLHGDDIHGRTAKNSVWKVATYPAVRRSPDGGETILWEDFRPRSYLEQRRRSMGELLFNQEYLLIPASSEASIFPARLFRDRPETLASWLRLGPTEHEIKARSDWTYYAGVDFALSASAGADYTVVVVLGVDKNFNRHLVELVRVKGMPYNQQLKMIEDVVTPYRHSLARIFLEANQAQRIFGDELGRKTDLPIHKFTTGSDKNALDRGVPSLRTLFENGKIRLARGDARSQEATDILMAELQGFSWLKGKLQGVGIHDDTVMALWIADCAVRSGSNVVVWEAMGDISDSEGLELLTEGQEARQREEMRTRWGVDWFGSSKPDMDAGAAPKLPDSSGDASPALFGGAAGKTLMVRQGYVPITCTLPDDTAGVRIWEEVNQGRSPCWTCRADRQKCGGQAAREGLSVKRILPKFLGAEDSEARPKTPEVQPRHMRQWVDTLSACAGDESLARQIPEDKQDRIDGWNALVAGSERPQWVDWAMSAGKADALYDALYVLLGLGG